MAAMTEISQALSDYLSSSIADLAKPSSQTASDLAKDAPHWHIELEKALTVQIELAVQEADQGNFATDDQVVTIRTSRRSRNADRLA